MNEFQSVFYIATSVKKTFIIYHIYGYRILQQKTFLAGAWQKETDWC